MPRWPLDQRTVRWSVVCILVCLTAAWQSGAAAPDPAGPEAAARATLAGVAPETTCAAAAAPGPAVGASWPAGVDEHALARWHGRLAPLPGFVDLHVVFGDTPHLVAYFAHAPPATLPDVGAPLPMTSTVLPPLETTVPMVGGDPPLVPGPCSGIRPGVGIWGCTYAFLVAGSDGHTYLATAGHCLPIPLGTDVAGVGTLAYRVDAGIGADFALVRLYPSIPRTADVCHWGGPTGVAAGTGGTGQVVRMYGHGAVFGMLDATKPRSGVLVSMGSTSFSYVGPVWSGDSGAPVILEDGLAVGVHTHGLSAGVGPPTPTLKFGTRWAPALSGAEAALGVDLDIVTAPLA